MGIHEDAWLTQRFGHGVYTVEPTTDAAQLRAHLAAAAPATYQAKVPVDRPDLVRGLGALGMYVVDANVTLARSPDGAGDGGQERWPVVEARPEHGPAVLEIARTAFRYSRFHLDPGVPDDVADRIKHDWAEGYLRGTRGEKLLVALDGDLPIGFLGVLALSGDGPDTRVVDLVAVARRHQGRGVGADLARAFVRDAIGRCELVQVGTQLANVPATRLYERLGFELARAAYVLHGHVSA